MGRLYQVLLSCAVTMSWAHNLLLATVRGDPPPRIASPEDEARLHTALVVAQRHGVGGWLASDLRARADVGPSLRIQLAATNARVAGNHRRSLAASTQALSALASID